MSLRTLHIGRVWQSEQAGGADRVPSIWLATFQGTTSTLKPWSQARSMASIRSVFSFGGNELGTRARWLGARRTVVPGWLRVASI